MKKLYKEIFDFKIERDNKISISNNEIYNQMLLYIFFSMPNDLIILTPNLNEANKLYNNLHNYTEDLYIFPEDDFLTKKAIATSPELLYMRLKLLNNIKKKEKKIVICHLNSYLKKLENPNNYENKKISFKIGKNFNRNDIINKLLEIGYKKESLVTNTGEFSIRGFVLDIFPIHEDKPIRIELFDEEIEKIKIFDENTQLSIKEVEEAQVLPIRDEYNEGTSSIIDYLNNPILLMQDKNQIINAENTLKEQIKYYESKDNNYKFLKEINSNFTIYVDLLDNTLNYDYIFKAEENKNYNENIKEFLNDLNNQKEKILYSTNSILNKEIKKNIKDVQIIEENINQGFKYKNIRYFSSNDLKKDTSKLRYDTGYKLGRRINDLNKLTVGDYVVHKTNGIGVYMGVQTLTKNHIKKDYILIKYKGNDKLYLPVEDINKLYKYSSKEGAKPKIHSLNSIEWKKTKLRIKGKIKEIREELLKLYQERSKSTTEPFNAQSPMEDLFAAEFEYEATVDQIKSFEEIKKDMESSKPMDRLLCGDVGYGKTEVIFRAMFKAVLNNKQVMYLCPTTLLSHQQYNSAVERFKNFGVSIAVLNRYTTLKEAKEIINKLKDKKIDIIFGTHRLLSNDIEFGDLGLLVIDEEQRFGVSHKEKIKKYKNNVHVLSVSATPIPRSLQMSLAGIRDLSLIETAPKNRYPVQTYVINYDEMILREVILKELARKGQVFILYNRIEKMPALVEKYKKLIPEARINYAHGAMPKAQIGDIMYDFTNGNFDVLISTTIIENGIDIPNANTIIVEDADLFGLAQLYQIRGRVGRSDRIAYAYLMYNKSKLLTETAVKRLEAIKEFTDLGSGYKIAMRDLSIRGAGDLLGTEQAGFIDSVGVDLYLDLINEEISDISDEDENKKVSIDDVETHIDEKYTTDDDIIIELHKKINSINTKEELKKLENEIEDRFGILGSSIKDYLYQEYLEKLLENLNIEIMINDNSKIQLKIKENIYKNLSIEELFIKTTQINTKFNFNYRNNYIILSLQKNNLERPYIYYLVSVMEYINKEKGN